MDDTEYPQPENESWPPPILDSNEPKPQPDLSKEIAFGRLSLASPLVFIILPVGLIILSIIFNIYSVPALTQALSYCDETLTEHAKLITAILEFSGLMFGFLGRKSSVGKFGLMMNLILLPFIALIEI